MEAIRQILIGAGSIFLVPMGLLPRPELTVTILSGTATQAIAGDFSRVAGDLQKAITKVENATQLEAQHLAIGFIERTQSSFAKAAGRGIRIPWAALPAIQHPVCGDAGRIASAGEIQRFPSGSSKGDYQRVSHRTIRASFLDAGAAKE